MTFCASTSRLITSPALHSSSDTATVPISKQASMENTMASTDQQLADAEIKYKKALELRDSDIDAAVDLLGQVLEVRNKAHGEDALECADTYLYYGQCLFEQAQAASDFFGDQMRDAANQRARAIAAADNSGDGPSNGTAAAAAAADMDDSTPMEDAAQAMDSAVPAVTATEASSPQQLTSADPAAEAPSTAAGTSTEGAVAEPPAEGSDQPGSGDAAAAAGDGDGDSDAAADADEEDADSEEMADEGQAEEGGAEPPQVTGESDDMALAWEMLELARLIYNKHGGPETYANKLADCHLYIGDILAEQEKFEAAVEEYKTAQDMLARLEGGHEAHRRRAAELEFKKATALQLLDAPTEALAAMQAAKAHLTAHLETINAKIAAAGSSGADVAGAVASAAFASILSGYGGSAPAPAAAAADGAACQPEIAKFHQEASDLKGTLESIGDRIEELSAAVQEHISMKEQLANIFKAVAAEGGAGGSSEQAAEGGVGSSRCAGETVVGFGAAGSFKPAGEVKELGVIGKGRRVAPMPVEAPAAAAAAAAAAATTVPSSAAPAAAEGSKAAVVGTKRALSDLSNSDQEQTAEGAAAAVKQPAAAAAVLAADEPDAAPKRACVRE